MMFARQSTLSLVAERPGSGYLIRPSPQFPFFTTSCYHFLTMQFSEHGIRATYDPTARDAIVEHESKTLDYHVEALLGENGIIPAFDSLTVQNVMEISSLDWSAKTPEDISRATHSFDHLSEHEELYRDNEAMRVEWLLSALLAEIPSLIARIKERTRLRAERNAIHAALRSPQGKYNDQQRNKLRDELQKRTSQLIKLNDGDSVWQIHMSELMGYLPFLEAKSPGITQNVCQTIFEVLKNYTTAISPTEEEDLSTLREVENLRLGVIGLRVLIQTLEKAGLSAFYPKTEISTKTGRESSTQDVLEGIDLWVVDSSQARAVAIQLKSHGPSQIPGVTGYRFTVVDENQIYRLKQFGSRSEKAMADEMEKAYVRLTNNGKYYTMGNASPGLIWVELSGLTEGEPRVDLITGETEGSIPAFKFTSAIKSQLEEGEKHVD